MIAQPSPTEPGLRIVQTLGRTEARSQGPSGSFLCTTHSSPSLRLCGAPPRFIHPCRSESIYSAIDILIRQKKLHCNKPRQTGQNQYPVVVMQKYYSDKPRQT